MDDEYVWVTVGLVVVAVVPSPKSQKYFSPLVLPLPSREKPASNVTVRVVSGLTGLVSKYATALGRAVAPRAPSPDSSRLVHCAGSSSARLSSSVGCCGNRPCGAPPVK